MTDEQMRKNLGLNPDGTRKDQPPRRHSVPSPDADKILAVDCNGNSSALIVPRSGVDVDNQLQFYAWQLATAAFAPVVNGRRCFSRFTADTFKRIEHQYGPDTLRRHLAALLDEMRSGFKPSNPVGLLIHRVRLTATDTMLC